MQIRNKRQDVVVVCGYKFKTESFVFTYTLEEGKIIIFFCLMNNVMYVDQERPLFGSNQKCSRTDDVAIIIILSCWYFCLTFLLTHE